MQKGEMLEVCVKKSEKPILNPSDFDWCTSIRNPGATVYKNSYGKKKIILLPTVRHNDGISRIHVASSPLEDGINFELEKTPLLDVGVNSLRGTEDARIVYNPLNKNYIITFTKFKEHIKEWQVNTTRIGLTTTTDFKTVGERITLLDEYENNKNCVIYIDEKTGVYWIYHRPFIIGQENPTTPNVLLAKSKNLEDFEDFRVFLKTRENMWDNARVGMNLSPIKIKHEKFGNTLLMLYHGASKTGNIYRMGYVLVNPENPSEILERSIEPLLSPELDWEIGKGIFKAEVSNVVFGCGLIPLDKSTLRLYYAGADKQTGYADIILKNAEVVKGKFNQTRF